jgi:RNA polymerase sigma-70 factor (ECF subfamily)
VDRAAWDQRLLRAGLDDAAAAIARSSVARSVEAPGRFALEAAISGVHATAPDAAGTDWPRLALLYDALLAAWPSPATRVARLVVLGRLTLRDGGDLGPVEHELEELVADGPPYAARDASLTLADLARRSGRDAEAAGRYRELLDVVPEGPLREFCRRYAG